jgi:paraquat-inducible protein B
VQQLLSGGVAFETSTTVLSNPPSASGADFTLYENRQHALRAARGPELVYAAEFDGNQRGLEPGVPVELDGREVGEVKESHLRFDNHQHKLLTHVTFSVDPDQVEIEDMPRAKGGDIQETVGGWLKTLVDHGMRAQVNSASFITGQKLIALDVAPNAPPDHIKQVGSSLEFPTTASADFNQILQNLRGVLQNLNRATGGPQLGHALQSLDHTLTNLDNLTRDVAPDLKSLVKSLRDTADAAQTTLSSVQGMMGSNANNAVNTDLPKLMRELEDAARSVRVLADYLDRHPEALLRGRKGDKE